MNAPFLTIGIILLLQGLAMVFDEFYFHRRRGLGIWESVGHPIDTLFYGLAFVIPLFLDQMLHAMLWLAIAILSCLIITKDEWIHTKQCRGGENWLHSILFILHPLSMIAAWYLWQWREQGNSLARFVLYGHSSIVFCFMAYQIIYWGKRHGQTKSR